MLMKHLFDWSDKHNTCSLIGQKRGHTFWLVDKCLLLSFLCCWFFGYGLFRWGSFSH